MATIKISDLAELTSPSDVTSTDLLHIINKDQTSSEYPTGTNRSIKASTLADGLGGLLTTIPPVIQTALNAKLNTSAYDPAGIKVATPVRAASTVTLTLSGINNGSSIDGVTLATGDRVLIKNQSTTTENGIYVVRASGGLIRATDFASGTDVKGYFVLVTAGTSQNGSGWAVTSDPAVIGTNSITFTQFSSALGTVTKQSILLGNVDNTSDLNKPISTLTQAALDTKQATITGAASTITTSFLTANRVLVSNGTGSVAESSITTTELGYLSGVNSSIQTQLNSKGAGTVTSVTGTAPISVSNGTSTPVISIATATTSASGAMSSTDKTRLDSASSVNGLVKCNGNGGFSAASSTDLQTFAIPAGAIMPFAQNSTPSGWAYCDGSEVPRGGDYAALWAAIQTTYGAGNGSTTFNLPDLRGIFVRGAGSQTIGETTYSGTHGATQSDLLKSHAHRITRPSTVYVYVNSSSTYNIGGGYLPGGAQTQTYPDSNAYEGGTETRPANIALRYCIKL